MSFSRSPKQASYTRVDVHAVRQALTSAEDQKQKLFLENITSKQKIERLDSMRISREEKSKQKEVDVQLRRSRLLKREKRKRTAFVKVSLSRGGRESPSLVAGIKQKGQSCLEGWESETIRNASENSWKALKAAFRSRWSRREESHRAEREK